MATSDVAVVTVVPDGRTAAGEEGKGAPEEARGAGGKSPKYESVRYLRLRPTDPPTSLTLTSSSSSPSPSVHKRSSATTSSSLSPSSSSLSSRPASRRGRRLGDDGRTDGGAVGTSGRPLRFYASDRADGLRAGRPPGMATRSIDSLVLALAFAPALDSRARSARAEEGTAAAKEEVRSRSRARTRGGSGRPSS